MFVFSVITFWTQAVLLQNKLTDYGILQAKAKPLFLHLYAQHTHTGIFIIIKYYLFCLIKRVELCYEYLTETVQNRLMKVKLFSPQESEGDFSQAQSVHAYTLWE